MFKNFDFKDQGTFLQSLHPAALLSYLAALLLLPLALEHPLYLAGLLLVGLFAAAVSGALRGWLSYLAVGLWAALLVMLLNPLLSGEGETVLFSLPALPLPGGRSITLEALCYGAVMAVRLLAVITAFSLYNTQVHPDKMTALLSRVAWKSALLISLSTRMIPMLARELGSAREVQQMRGVDFSSGNLRRRLQKYGRLLELLLISSLEGSLQTAEAMQARAYGCGRRSSYFHEPVRPRDYLCFLGSLSALLLAVYARVRGFAAFSFYPRLEHPAAFEPTLFYFALIMFFLLLPLMTGWGWQRWHYLRSKI